MDKNGKGWSDAKAPSAGYIAWLLWGGDAGQRWAAHLYARLQEASAKQGASSRNGSKDGLINATGKRSNRIRRAEGAQIAD
ncbi:DNA-binding protein, partial [Xanthomonas vasicola pv. musacearum]|nr:DNA-binding protein [Xanthomonas vasicola pv. musacearum]